ncbi:DNA repair protein REV1 [Drosophila serrata]|uniref:DNA repair protein REV1 n=1 Tax=Drosophila serrata TaxID=7274 RepID=UPI000A1CF600|nr:DNA repair protein REV1 [Drosophila serrata]
MTRDEDNGFGEWGGYFEAKKSKLEEQFAAASDPFRKSDLFQGISIFVNGRTDPSADELKRIMMVHGGTYHHYERSHTTYTIASTLPDVKVRNMNLSKFISAKWVVDCLAQNKIVDYKPYLLFTNQKTSQPGINFANVKNRSVNETKKEAKPPKEDMEVDLFDVLEELQQAVFTSPEKKAEISSLSETNQSINNLSSTSSNSNHARTASDPRFLSEFYKNSRLHHIATLGAGFKQYVCELRQANANKGFPMRAELKYLKKSTDSCEFRYVMHIDMDCFFVSVGLRSRPELRGLPVAVTHSKGGSGATDVPVHPQADRQLEQELFAQRFEHRMHDDTKVDKVRSGFDKKMSLSELASCSYEARDKGIRNGMFVGQALKLCPELKTIPYDFDGYREVAYTLYDTVAQYTLNIEAVSCDEMFVELTDMVSELKVDVIAFVEHLRQEVRTKTGCPCSAGVGPNKLLARLATKKAKPNGQHLLSSNQDFMTYMAPMALESLPGVGSSMSHKLKQAGMTNCGDVQQTSLVKLGMLLGRKVALNLHNNCRGIDPRPLVYEQARKTVSAEMNFGIRFSKVIECEQFLRQLSDEVTKRLIEVKRKTKSINLKIMVRAAEAPVETSKYMGHGVCDIINKSSNLKHATDDINVITTMVLNLMKEADLPVHELRGLGIHLTKLEDVAEVKKENVLKEMFMKITEKRTRDPIEPPKKKPAPEITMPEVKIKQPRIVLEMLKTAAEAQKPLIAVQEENTGSNGGQPTPNAEVGPGGIDPDFLAELPDDLRRELLNNAHEHLLMEKENKFVVPSDNETRPPPPCIAKRPLTSTSPLNASDLQPSTSRAGQARLAKKAAARAKNENCRSDQIVEDYINELPNHTHPALLQYINRSPEEVPTRKKLKLGDYHPAIPSKKEVGSTILEGDFKNVLNGWVSNVDVPLPADVNIIYTQMCHLLKADKLNLMYDVMRHLCRLINAKRGSSCHWHLAYNHIEMCIQDMMMELHGYHMHLTETIRCAKCNVF